jgi:hypothetical protein
MAFSLQEVGMGIVGLGLLGSGAIAGIRKWRAGGKGGGNGNGQASKLPCAAHDRRFDALETDVAHLKEVTGDSLDRVEKRITGVHRALSDFRDAYHKDEVQRARALGRLEAIAEQIAPRGLG